MQARNFELIILDLDETLIDIPNSYSFFDEMIIETLKKMSIPTIPSQEERDRLWRTGRDWMLIVKKWGIDEPKKFWNVFDELDF